MKKSIHVILCTCFTTAMCLLITSSGFAYQKVNQGCLTCHPTAAGTGLHTIATHSTCATCHPGGIPGKNVLSSSCIVCHPSGNTGFCPLIDLPAHASQKTTCLGCHPSSSCFDDNDNDGVDNYEDNCPNKPNGPNLGTCMSGSNNAGAPCNSDTDCVIGCSSNGQCSKNQEDTDNDGVGDVCDGCSVIGGDSDFDNVCDNVDNCPTVNNPDQNDSDGDGLGDRCDNCPFDCNPSQEDSNSNGIGDVCDPEGVQDSRITALESKIIQLEQALKNCGCL
jgi:hypothetical protein